jgi:hypothetical protein
MMKKFTIKQLHFLTELCVKLERWLVEFEVVEFCVLCIIICGFFLIITFVLGYVCCCVWLLLLLTIKKGSWLVDCQPIYCIFLDNYPVPDSLS